MHLNQENLEMYALGRLGPGQIPTVESHLAECASCVEKLNQVVHAPGLSRGRLGNYSGEERRREHRIPADDPAGMISLSPYSNVRSEIRILDVSRSGLKLRVSKHVGTGSIVQIRVRNAILLAEVRYCVAVGDEIHAGVRIQDVVPTRRS